jgi:hypothetical protein
MELMQIKERLAAVAHSENLRIRYRIAASASGKAQSTQKPSRPSIQHDALA